MKAFCRHWIVCFLLITSAHAHADALFWDTPQRGANSFNRLPPDQAYFDALRGYGATWVRLSHDKWPAAQRDFLLGDADKYSGLVQADLQMLIATLDRAHAAGLKVVITPLSLPGMRWAQNNHGQFDDRLWQDARWWDQAGSYWADLAAALRHHPGLAAYNLLNEPAPEKGGGMQEHASAAVMKAWYASVQGSARDLPAFYQLVIERIRAIDPDTPIMLDAGWYASADAFSYWPAALKGSRLLYSVHMYEPYEATSAPNLTRATPHQYPGPVPFAGQIEHWDAARVRRYLQVPLDWAIDNGLSPRQLVVGEFGCVRRLPGCRAYLEDVLQVLEKQQVHWAFYAFREDAWDGMDYELGTKAVPWSYWQAVESGTPDSLPRHAGEIFEPIARRLKAPAVPGGPPVN